MQRAPDKAPRTRKRKGQATLSGTRPVIPQQLAVWRLVEAKSYLRAAKDSMRQTTE
jgi:hypothetical protein